MIPFLLDLCYHYILNNFESLGPAIRDTLPTRLKEVLLARLSERQGLVKLLESCVKEFLFVPEIRNVVLNTSYDIYHEGGLLDNLASKSCKLRSLKIQHDLKINSLSRSSSKIECTRAICKCLKGQDELGEFVIANSFSNDFEFLSEIECVNLRHFRLEVNRAMPFTEDFIEKVDTLTSKSKHLRSVVIHVRPGRDTKYDMRQQSVIWNVSVQRIALNLRENLLRLDVEGAPCLTTETIEVIASQCPNLKAFAFTSVFANFGFSADALVSLQENCKLIENINIKPTYFSNRSIDKDIHHHSREQYEIYIPSSVYSLSLTPLRIRDTVLITHWPDHLGKLVIPMIFIEEMSVQTIFSHIGRSLTDIDFPCPSPLGGYLERRPNKDLECAVIRAIVDYCPNLESLGLCCFHEAALQTLKCVFDNSERACNFRCLRLFADYDAIENTLFYESNYDLSEVGDEDSHQPHLADVDYVHFILNAIIESCKCLTKFTVNSKYMDDTLLTNIADNCQYLTHLYIQSGYCDTPLNDPRICDITDVGVCALASKCNLHALYLRGSPLCKITAVSILSLAHFCPYLQFFDYTPEHFRSSSEREIPEHLRKLFVRGIDINCGPIIPSSRYRKMFFFQQTEQTTDDIGYYISF